MPSKTNTFSCSATARCIVWTCWAITDSTYDNRHIHTIQYNTIARCIVRTCWVITDSTYDNTMQCDAMRCDAIQYNTIRPRAVSSGPAGRSPIAPTMIDAFIQYNTIRYDTIHYNTIRPRAVSSGPAGRSLIAPTTIDAFIQYNDEYTYGFFFVLLVWHTTAKKTCTVPTSQIHYTLYSVLTSNELRPTWSNKLAHH